MAGFFRGEGAGPRVIAVVAVAVLALVVGVLSILALQTGRDAGTTDSPRPAPSFSFGDRSSSSATPTPSPPPSTSRSQERFLAVQGDQLWRATAGACGDVPPVVELSTDSGATWTDVTPAGLSQVLGVAGLAESDGELVGAMGADCQPAVLRTYTSGLDWESYDALVSTAYLEPADGITVHTPDGDVMAPCASATSVRMSRGTVGLICDGVAYRLTDTGDWALVSERAIALDAVGGNLLVAHSSATCPGGISITQFGDAAEDELGCIDGIDTADPAALSVLDDDIVLWSEATIVRH